MPVTDLQVATVRALLNREFDECRRLMDQLGDDGLRYGYFPLITAAFLDTAKQRFRGKKRSDIVEWVAEVRAQQDVNEQIDPNVAERLLLWAFERASIDDIDATVSDGHQAMLLAALVSEQHLDHAALDALLQEARETVDTALSQEE